MNRSEAEQFDLILRQSERFSYEAIVRLSRYYQFVLKWNARLHLTTITQPQDFFERHIFESSLVAEKISSTVDQVWDIGSGAGVPGLIIAILRPNLAVHLVESSRKKALFLEEAVAELNLANVTVINRRVESLESLPESSCMTVRAMEEMEGMIPVLINLGNGGSQMIFLGAKTLDETVRVNLIGRWDMESSIIPGSYRSYLINAHRST